MRKLTDCLKINKEIDKSNNSQIIHKIHQIQQLVEKEQIKIIKIAITHLEMESQTPQPLSAKRSSVRQIHVFPFQRLNSD